MEDIRRRVIDTDPLYVNFTSGSTGTPKGIVVCHRSVIDFIENFTPIFNITDEETVEYQKVARTKNYLVVPANHPKANRSGLTMADFADDTYLSLSESESQFINLSSHGRPAGKKTLVAPDIGTLALWLEAGYGIFTFNGNHALRNNPNLRFLDIPELGETTEIIMWKRGNKNPMIEMFRKQFPTIE